MLVRDQVAILGEVEAGCLYHEVLRRFVVRYTELGGLVAAFAGAGVGKSGGGQGRLDVHWAGGVCGGWAVLGQGDFPLRLHRAPACWDELHSQGEVRSLKLDEEVCGVSRLWESSVEVRYQGCG